jgi:hypothetical protein
MTLSADDSRLMAQLMDNEKKPTVDLVLAAGNSVIDLMIKAGIPCLQDDRRAELDAAIYRYVLRCMRMATK